MTTVFLTPISSIFQYFNDTGVVLAGGKINTYLAGTSTPQATYTDSTGTTPNSNPIILASNGRLNNVQIWQPQGIKLKVIITDSNNNQIGPVFDQLYGIGDPTPALTSLADPTQGARLVADAVKSYDIIASVISAPAPSPAAGETVVIDIEGASVPTDNGGGLFYWNSTATDTADNVNVIKPTSVGSGAGRYLRQRQSGFTIDNGTTLAQFNGLTTTTCNTSVYVVGNIVVMRIRGGGTSNSTSFGVTVFSSGTFQITPSFAHWVSVGAMVDSGTTIYSQVARVNPWDGVPGHIGQFTIDFFKNGNITGWTNTGTKAVGANASDYIVLTWLLN